MLSFVVVVFFLFFFFREKSFFTKFSTGALRACEQHGALDWKTLKMLKFLRKQNFYEFFKNRIFRKMTTDFENRSMRQAETMSLFGHEPQGYTCKEQVQSILQPEISIHFAHFRFECKKKKTRNFNNTIFMREKMFPKMLSKAFIDDSKELKFLKLLDWSFCLHGCTKKCNSVFP